MGMIDHTEFHSLFLVLSYSPDGSRRTSGKAFPSGVWFRAMDRWLIVEKFPSQPDRTAVVHCVSDLAGDLNQLPEHARLAEIIDDTHARIFDDLPDNHIDGIDWHELNENSPATRVETGKERSINRWM